MDFWDLTKVVFRRWQIALPLFLLTVGLTALTVSAVKPDYVATSYIQLIPPVPQQAKPGQPVPEQRNPWLSQGLQTLGNAAVVTMLDKSVVDRMKTNGLSDSYTAEFGNSTPLLKIEITAKSPEQAENTANELVEQFGKSVASLQTAYGVSSVDLITTRRLDLGKNVEKSDSKVKRAVVAVFGAGVLLMVAITIGVDAWIRRRNSPPSSLATGAPQELAIGMAAAAYSAGEPPIGRRPRAITRMSPATIPQRAASDPSWPSRRSVVYQAAPRNEIEEVVEDMESADDSTIVIPNFLPKNGAEIIPPPSEWLVNDRDGNS